MFKKKSPNMEKLKKKYLCLDLGSYSLKGVVGSGASGKPKIEFAFEEVLPVNFYENGRFANPAEFGILLNAICDKHQVKVRDLIITMDTSELIKREVILPDVENLNLNEAISYELADQLPIDINNYILQPRVMAKFTEDGQRRQRVLVAALPRDMVKPIFTSLQEEKFSPDIFDIHSNGIEKMFTPEFVGGLVGPDQTVALVDLGHKNSNITILENGEYRFNRILRVGGESIVNILNEFAIEPNSSLYRSLFQADLLQKISPEDEDETSLQQIIIKQIIEIINDVEKVVAYYGSRNTSQGVNKIILYGGSSRFKNLGVLFEQRLGIPTLALAEVYNIDFPMGLKDRMYKYINTFSALIRR